MAGKFSKSRKEQVFFASCWEVEHCVEGGNSSRQFQEDGLEAGGLGGDNRDEGGEGGVPHYHGATSGLDLVQGEVLVMKIFRVEMSIVIAKEGGKEEVEITGVKHGLTEENKHGFVELSKISQGLMVSGETLYIPGENWKTFKRFCFRT